MLLSELFENNAFYIFEAPAKREIDPDTGLLMNLPNEWSASPYFGAVKTKGGYVAQIHFRKDTYSEVIADNENYWRSAGLADSFFNGIYDSNLNSVPPIRLAGIVFGDPRSAAYLVQNVRFDDDKTEQIEYEIETLTQELERITDQRQDTPNVESIIASMPNFDGAPITLADKEIFFAKKSERDTSDAIKKNTNDFYTNKAPAIIKDKYIKLSPSKKKKLFGTKSKNTIEQIIDLAIQDLGAEWFFKEKSINELRDGWEKVDFGKYIESS